MRPVILSSFVRAVMEAIYPPTCCVCGDFFDISEISPSPNEDKSGRQAFAGFMAPHMCPSCVAGYTPVESPLCTICGVGFKSRHSRDHVCGECQRVSKLFHSARAAGIYEKSLMTVLQQLKYHGRVELADALGGLLLSAFLKWYDPADVDLIAPVPLHPRKQRQRGFNQAWLMVRHWCRPGVKGCFFSLQNKIQKDLLKRTRLTRSQTKLSRRERLDNVHGAFILSDPDQVKGRSVLLIDDVYTTGATVNECARVLKAGGASRIDILTAARVR